ncbi:putative reverse transcriptase, RNA-dependent DNA polymerase [Tanacetum coccineum]
MGKSSRNKRKQLEKYQLIYSNIGPSLSTRKLLTWEEAKREALVIDICRRYSLLEEERPVIETMAYNDKYKNILDGICLDKMKLDGEIKKEEEKAITKIKGEALIEKEDHGAFMIRIRLEGKINLNALADTGSDINVMPYRVYKELGREELKKVNKGITMLNHSKAEPMGLMKDVMCQVGVTTIIAKFLILDMHIERDTPIIVRRGFLYTCGSIVNTIERITSTFDRICHQTFYAAKTSLDIAESDSDNEEKYVIQRNKFGASIYRPKTAQYLNCNDPMDRSLALLAVLNPFRKTMGTHDDEAGSSRSKRSRQYETVEEAMFPRVHHPFLLWEGCNQAAKSRYNTKLAQLLPRLIYSPCVVDWNTLLEFTKRLGLYNSKEIEEEGFDVYFQGGLHSDEHFNWLSISREENLSLSRSYASTIRNPVLRVLHKMITYGLCQRTTGWMKRKGAGSQKESMICCGQFITKIAKRKNLLFKEVLNSLSASIYYRSLDTTTLRELIDYEGRLIHEAPKLGVPGVAIPRPLRESMYPGVFEHMAGVYSVPLQGAYKPPGYDQQQYDQYF